MCACTSANGVDNLLFIGGIMDHYTYLSILRDNLNSSVQKLGLERHYLLQKDNVSKHTAKLVIEGMTHSICLLHTSPQSQDVNPIKHL